MIVALRDELKRFQEIVRDPYATVSAEKQRTGKKVLGLFPMHIPHELVYAAGVLPVSLWESNEPITVAHAHYTPYNCALSRSVIDDVLKDKLTSLDGIIFYDICLQAKGLPFIIGRHRPALHQEITYLPSMIHPSKAKTSAEFLTEKLQTLKQDLEEYVGHAIADADIREAIAIYNESRSLLRRVYDVRRRSPWLLTTRQTVSVVWSAMLMDRRAHNEELRGAVAALEEAEKTTPAPKAMGPKVVLFGHPCFAPSFPVVDLIEESGGRVVDDDIYMGGKYIANDCATDGDPIAALVERYMRRTPPCITKVDWEYHPGDYATQLAKESNAQGVIQLIVKFCPPHLCCSADISRRLMKNGVPDMVIEIEHELTSLEQVRSRLQAFVESLQESVR